MNVRERGSILPSFFFISRDPGEDEWLERKVKTEEVKHHLFDARVRRGLRRKTKFQISSTN